MMDFEYTGNQGERLATCRCCGVKIPASQSITRDGATFCKDSGACVWRQQGKQVSVEYYATPDAAQKPLFGD